MSQHQFFKRTAVPAQVAVQMQTISLPAPTRGIVMDENETAMQPGGAITCDNWKPTLKGASLRGGSVRYVDLHAPPGASDWQHSHAYAIDARAMDTADMSVWLCNVAHTSSATGSFATERLAHPTYWTLVPSPPAAAVWQHSHAYVVGDHAADTADTSVWACAVAHTSAAGNEFPVDRLLNPTYWTRVPALAITDPVREPIISAFEYVVAGSSRIFAAQPTKIWEVTNPAAPVLIKSGQTSGNYTASQLSNQGGDWMLVVNDAGDPVLRFDGTSWVTLATTTPANWAISTAYAVGARALDTTNRSYWKCAVAHTSPATGTFEAARIASPTQWVPDQASDGVNWITGPAGTPVENGLNLVHVCKYRDRYFFIEKDSMNAWYLPLNAVGGALLMIPLSGSASLGGKLLFSAVWSIDAGDGTDDKLVFATTLGELLIFSGGDPSVATNWRQEGRYQMSPPMGQNAHILIGGDLLIATQEGILPTSGAITKGRAELELAAVTRTIKPLWRNEVLTKRTFPWTMCKWDTFGGVFVTWPGGRPGKYVCAAVNAATGAWARFTGWDATCFMRLDDRMFFGTQSGIVMEADRGGTDDGLPYVCTLVGGWEMFHSGAQTATWLQARARYASRTTANFNPQLASMVDGVYALPDAPPIAEDPGPRGLWDEGEWDESLWDAGLDQLPVKNTLWMSIGTTGFSHAPVVQVTIAQESKPELDLISIDATFSRLGVNV